MFQARLLQVFFNSAFAGRVAKAGMYTIRFVIRHQTDIVVELWLSASAGTTKPAFEAVRWATPRQVIARPLSETVYCGLANGVYADTPSCLWLDELGCGC